MTDKPRRKPGEGSIRPYETAAGTRWLICYGVTDPATGKRRQKLQRGFKNERAAGTALRSKLVKVDRGEHVEPSKRPVRDYLREWCDGLRNEASTIASYRRNLEQHVMPRIGATPLANVTGVQLTAMYRELEAGGRRDGKACGLSARTVRYVHTIVHRALKDAVEADLLIVNPADRAKPPSPRQAKAPEMQTWSAEQLRAFLDWSEKNDDLAAAWRLLAMTGMRRGEALGLRWGDVDFDNATVSVRRSTGLVRDRGTATVVTTVPKTSKARVIDLDEQTLGALRSHRASRASLSLLLARDDALVIANPDGTVRHPERFSREFARRLARCRDKLGEDALPVIRLHDLRHTHATILLRAGVHPKIVSERLGHAKVSITLDVYSHAVPSLQREAATKLAALVYGGRQ